MRLRKDAAMKDDPKTKDDAKTTQSSEAPRKLKIKTSTRPPAADSPALPCTTFID